MPKGRTKDPMARETFICLWSWLMGNCLTHVLEWTDRQNREFSILFMNKRNREWTEKHLDLFKALDNISPKKAARYQLSPDYDKDCKKRCKSNLQKLCKDKILKHLGIEEIKESIKKYHYRFLEVPSSYLEKKNVQLNAKSYDPQVEKSIEVQILKDGFPPFGEGFPPFGEDNTNFNVNSYDPQLESSIKIQCSGESCLPKREDSTNFNNYNSSLEMGGAGSSLCSFGGIVNENLPNEIEESICLNNNSFIQPVENNISSSDRWLSESLRCKEDKSSLNNSNFIQPVENNISSSDRWLSESLDWKAEGSVTLNNIENYTEVQAVDWDDCSELVKYVVEEEIPNSNDEAVRRNHHLIKDEDPLWSMEGCTEYVQMEPSVPSLF